MTREKAIKIIKEFISGTCLHTVDQEALETLIPELKENEDESIRKEIIKFIQDFCNPCDPDCDKWIAYLEKQKEQKPAEVCYGPKGDPDPAGIQTEKDVEKYPEDKSFEAEWKDYYNNILVSRLPMNKREVAKHFYWFAKKNAWKPSEEQMDAFHTVLYQPQYISNSDDERLKQAESLYNDLEKLM